MATLTIKGIEPELLERLRVEAQRHRRSLNQEVITRLETSAGSVPVDPTAFLARVRQLRITPRKSPLTDRLVNRLKRQGRP